MGAKNEEAQRRKDVESAIRSLYDRFPKAEDRYGNCSNIQTKETNEIRRRIKKRKAVLDNDPEMKKLNKELKEETCKVMTASKVQRDKVDDLLRKLQVRGASPELEDEIERLSKEKPAYVQLCCCDDDDDE
jgi:beta-phosphoglucomutase-like phosphatase (HAD superfamily)